MLKTMMSFHNSSTYLVAEDRNILYPDILVCMGYARIGGSKIVMKHTHIIATKGVRRVR
jgi:hypothetical protein